MRVRLISAWLAAALAAAAPAGADAASGEAAPSRQGRSDAAKPAARTEPPPAQGPRLPLGQQYCEAVQDAAAEARFAFQKSQLEALSGTIEEKLKRLETRSAELKELIAKRESFVKQATSQLVGIYSAMRPESASEQLVRMAPGTAAAILGQLDQRAASAILNDMAPEKAARLTSLMMEAARRSGGGAP